MTVQGSVKKFFQHLLGWILILWILTLGIFWILTLWIFWILILWILILWILIIWIISRGIWLRAWTPTTVTTSTTVTVAAWTSTTVTIAAWTTTTVTAAWTSTVAVVFVARAAHPKDHAGSAAGTAFAVTTTVTWFWCRSKSW